ncbi:quinone oxidoreductase [Silvimonas sp. JCM 19000]
MQTQVIRLDTVGDPSVMQLADVELADPGPGEVQLRHTAIGVNFIDTYHRSGLYPVKLPSGLGQEAAGVVEKLGAGVSDLKIGDRVAYPSGPLGSYARHRNFPANKLVPIPDDIPDEIAAGSLMRGMTAQYLLKQTFEVKPGMTVLIHAAAGGVGQIACQWAQALGATVIGTAGSEAKCRLARPFCDHVIDYTNEHFAERVHLLTGNKGVPVVYDGVGAATFEGSLASLAPRGLLVSFGNASGPVPPFSPNLLASKGSLYLTRPTLGNYASTRAELLAMAADYFAIVASGRVRVTVNQRYPLADAAHAHRDLEARKTTGSTVLIP